MLSPETWRLGSLMKALRVVCYQLCDLRGVLNVSEPQFLHLSRLKDCPSLILSTKLKVSVPHNPW